MTDNPIIDKLINDRVKNQGHKYLHNFKLDSTTKAYYEMIQVVAHQYARQQIKKDREETIKLHLLTSNGELAKRIRDRPIILD